MDTRTLDLSIDRIHYLLGRSEFLKSKGNHGDAQVLITEAEYHADFLKKNLDPLLDVLGSVNECDEKGNPLYTTD